jgi:hypothetical protein
MEINKNCKIHFSIAPGDDGWECERELGHKGPHAWPKGGPKYVQYDYEPTVKDKSFKEQAQEIEKALMETYKVGTKMVVAGKVSKTAGLKSKHTGVKGTVNKAKIKTVSSDELAPLDIKGVTPTWFGMDEATSIGIVPESSQADALKYDESDNVKEKAKALGLDIITPGEYEVQIDIDTPADIKHLRTGLKILKDKNEGYKFTRLTTSKSGNKHVYITFDRAWSPIERIVVQACLGSDRKRELLSMMRVFNKSNNAPTVLFEAAAKSHLEINGHDNIDLTLQKLAKKEKFDAVTN